jgi:aspartyl-tRNA(Asn)/glutamyl-tRNA(Gln) amidotransferase subunit C
MPATLSRAQVEAVAALANLDLDESEIETFGRQLSDILDYAAELQRIDTTGVPPTASVSARHSADRPDEVAPSLSREDALANAPEGNPEIGLFKVPRVIG